MIKELIQALVDGKDLPADQARAAMNEIMSGEATPAQIGAFLTALRMKGETVEEIAALASVMREKATRVPVQNIEGLTDTCGTGGDKSGTFNISTVVAFVVAGAGVKVAKHGNKALTSKCGSADVLAQLGVVLELTPENVGRCIDECGIGFLFAPSLHGAMKYAGPPRREIGIRTVFNVLGPLTNPAGAKRQVLGVFDSDLCEKLAEVLRLLGGERALVVGGMDGLDEITTVDETRIAELRDGKIRSFYVTPEEYGMKRVKVEELKGGDLAENAAIVRNILGGETGARRDIVLLNAAAGLVASGKVDTLKDGVALAAETIDSKNALKALDNLVALSKALS